MDYILITLKMPNLADLDLKIPVFITGAELIKMLLEITGAGFSLESKIQAEPLGRILDNTQTLYAEGVGHGALLTLL
jgi:uncharacterized ubiquitin-like protein YukD